MENFLTLTVLTLLIVCVFFVSTASAQPPQKRHVLENPAVRLEFDNLGRLVQFLNKRTSTAFLADVNPATIIIE